MYRCRTPTWNRSPHFEPDEQHGWIMLRNCFGKEGSPKPHRWYPLDQRGDPRPLLRAALALLDNVASAPAAEDMPSISVVVLAMKTEIDFRAGDASLIRRGPPSSDRSPPVKAIPCSGAPPAPCWSGSKRR